jgi:hypothetical protein
MTEVYILQHTHDLNDDDQDIKLIGVYSTEEKAQKAISKLSSLPGFKDTLQSFYIDKYEIDKDHWSEGFTNQFTDYPT